MLEKEGYDVVGAAFEVYNTLGSGFLEEVYQHAMEIELERRHIAFNPQQGMRLRYKDVLIRKVYIADIVAFSSMIIELKAVNFLIPDHFAQLLNYLRASKLSVGYLINFGNPGKLEWRRIVLD